MSFQSYKQDLYDETKKHLKKTDISLAIEPGSNNFKMTYFLNGETANFEELTCYRLIRQAFKRELKPVWGKVAVDSANKGKELEWFIEGGVVKNEELLKTYMQMMNESMIKTGIYNSSGEVILAIILPARAKEKLKIKTIECFKKIYGKIIVLDEVTSMLASYPCYEDGKKVLPTRLGGDFGAYTRDWVIVVDGLVATKKVKDRVVEICDSRRSDAGIHIDELIQRLIGEHYGVEISLDMAREIKELYWNMVFTYRKKKKIRLVDTSNRPEEIELTPAIADESLAPTIESSASDIPKLLDLLDISVRNRVIEDEMIISGGLMKIEGLAGAIEVALKEEEYDYSIIAAINPKFGSTDGGFTITRQFKEAFGK